jgi:6,7-dimethyl-8-ribityllumazine synthase
MDVMLKFNKPISFCVLTDLNQQQSLDRSGGKHGNKGIECAAALLQMVKLQKKL